MKFQELKQAIYEDFVEYWRKDGYTKSEPVSYFVGLFAQKPTRVRKAIKQMVVEDMLILCEETSEDEPHYKLSPMAYTMTAAALEDAGKAPPAPHGERWVNYGTIESEADIDELVDKLL